MDARPATLLRYRFGSLQQLHSHLHVVEGRTLFFLPRSPLAGGARVVVEFGVAGTEQVSTLRGSVLARVDAAGGQGGVWIEFPDAKLARKVDQGMAALAGRHQRRVGCDMLVELKCEGMPYLGRMIDVSLHGVRILGNASLRPGAEVEVRILGAELPNMKSRPSAPAAPGRGRSRSPPRRRTRPGPAASRGRAR